MKKITILVLSILVCLPSIALCGRKKTPKSGKIKDNIYTDAEYKFQITLPDNWKAKRGKKGESLRVSLQKEKNEKLNRIQNLNDPIWSVVNSGSYINIPIVNLWVVETKMTADDYLGLFISDSDTSDFKKEFVEAIQPVWSDATFKEFTNKKINKFMGSDCEVYNWSGTYIHSYLVAENRADMPLGGTIYTCKISDSSILFISLKTEIEVIDQVTQEIQSMVNTLKVNK